MKQSESIQNGTRDANEMFDKLSADIVDTVSAMTSEHDAFKYLLPSGFKVSNKTYSDAFTRQIMARYRQARNARPEVKEAHKIQSLRWTAESDLRAFDDVKTKFMKTFETNPQYAMEWAEGLFEATARREAAVHMLYLLDGEPATDGNPGRAPMTSTEVQAVFQKEALRRARYPEHSTSPSSNLAKEYLTAAYARYVS